MRIHHLIASAAFAAAIAASGAAYAFESSSLGGTNPTALPNSRIRTSNPSRDRSVACNSG